MLTIFFVNYLLYLLMVVGYFKKNNNGFDWMNE